MTISQPRTSTPERDKALNLIFELQKWADHKRACSIFMPFTNPESDYCSCGYAAAMRDFEKRYKDLR